MRDAETFDGLRDEERLAASLIQQSRRDDIRFLSYPEPDILCALPVRTVARRYPRALLDLADEEGYWGNLIARWRHGMEAARKRVAFKKWVATEVLGLREGNNLPLEALAETRVDDSPSPALAEALVELSAHLADASLWR